MTSHSQCVYPQLSYANILSKDDVYHERVTSNRLWNRPPVTPTIPFIDVLTQPDQLRMARPSLDLRSAPYQPNMFSSELVGQSARFQKFQQHPLQSTPMGATPIRIQRL